MDVPVGTDVKPRPLRTPGGASELGPTRETVFVSL
jgi:hypothetical protein